MEKIAEEVAAAPRRWRERPWHFPLWQVPWRWEGYAPYDQRQK